MRYQYEAYNNEEWTVIMKHNPQNLCIEEYKFLLKTPNSDISWKYQVIFILFAICGFTAGGWALMRYYTIPHIESYLQNTPTANCTVLSITPDDSGRTTVYIANVSYVDIDNVEKYGTYHMSSKNEFQVGSVFKCLYEKVITPYETAVEYLSSAKQHWWVGSIVAGSLGLIMSVALVLTAISRVFGGKHHAYSSASSPYVSISDWGPVEAAIQPKMACILDAYSSNAGGRFDGASMSKKTCMDCHCIYCFLILALIAMLGLMGLPLGFGIRGLLDALDYGSCLVYLSMAGVGACAVVGTLCVLYRLCAANVIRTNSVFIHYVTERSGAISGEIYRRKR